MVDNNIRTIDGIPHGDYCYDEHGVCPYWSRVKRPDGEYGYCAKTGDEDCVILWDQCKTCGINEPEESEYEQ
jgi:hypothetical protein